MPRSRWFWISLALLFATPFSARALDREFVLRWLPPSGEVNGYRVYLTTPGTPTQTLDLGAVSRIWRGGCIIRAQFLNRIADAYAETADLPVLLAAPYFVEALGRAQDAWRHIVATAATGGIPAPAFSSSLAYYDGLRAARLPAQLGVRSEQPGDLLAVALIQGDPFAPRRALLQHRAAEGAQLCQARVSVRRGGQRDLRAAAGRAAWLPTARIRRRRPVECPTMQERAVRI